MAEYIACPWCGENDFDLEGLKQHLTVGGMSYGPCEAFANCGRNRA